jgi:hypothetical protein
MTLIGGVFDEIIQVCVRRGLDASDERVRYAFIPVRAGGSVRERTLFLRFEPARLVVAQGLEPSGIELYSIHYLLH